MYIDAQIFEYRLNHDLTVIDVIIVIYIVHRYFNICLYINIESFKSISIITCYTVDNYLYYYV